MSYFLTNFAVDKGTYFFAYFSIEMGTLDIILLIAFIPALVTGITKGFVSQVVALASVILGAWLAYRFSGTVSAWLAPSFNIDGKFLQIISFTIIVIVTIVVLHLVGRLLTGVLKLAMLGGLNRILGLIFAVFKAALVLGLLVSVFEGFNAQWSMVKPEVLADSPVYMALKGFALKVFPYLKSLIVNG